MISRIVKRIFANRFRSPNTSGKQPVWRFSLELEEKEIHKIIFAKNVIKYGTGIAVVGYFGNKLFNNVKQN